MFLTESHAQFITKVDKGLKIIALDIISLWIKHPVY